jgi:uncharacterized protein (DUF2141 family)
MTSHPTDDERRRSRGCLIWLPVNDRELTAGTITVKVDQFGNQLGPVCFYVLDVSKLTHDDKFRDFDSEMSFETENPA